MAYTIKAVQFEHNESNENQITRYKRTEFTIGNKLDTDWWNNVNIAEKYAEHRQEILDTPAEFQEICDTRSDCFHIVKLCLETTAPVLRPINSALYRAGPKARKIKKTEIDKMLQMNDIEPAQSEWTSPILFSPKKDGLLWLCTDYKNLIVLDVKDAYPILQRDESLDSLGSPRILSTSCAIPSYWKI